MPLVTAKYWKTKLNKKLNIYNHQTPDHADISPEISYLTEKDGKTVQLQFIASRAKNTLFKAPRL